MGFNPPVPEQDNNWEIRVAVLLSLLLQVLLIFLGPIRKRSSASWSRFIIWSCYLLADWVADLALGLLLNNMGSIGGGSSSTSSFGLKRGGGGGATVGNSNGGSPIIFAFWTPFLLLHLGGPDTITAYSLEDNELWVRHLIGFVFELFSACIIFGCSVHGNPMILATMLMFVVGIIKYCERTYSLYSGSVDGFRSKILGEPDPGRNYAKFMMAFDSRKKAGLVVEVAIPNGEASVAKKEMERQDRTRQVLHTSKTSVEGRAYDSILVFRRLFVDLILSSNEQRLSQALFLEMTPREAFEVIETELNFIYDMVYTKAPVAYMFHGWVLRGVCSCCLVSALLVFVFLDKTAHGMLPVDVAITYALLLGGLALDAAALLMIFFSDRARVFLEESRRLRGQAWLRRVVTKRWRWWRTRRWSETVAQFILISYCLGAPDSNSVSVSVIAKMTQTTKPVGRVLAGFGFLPLLRVYLVVIQHQSLRIKYRSTERYSSAYKYIEESKLLKEFFDSIKYTALQLTAYSRDNYTEIDKVLSCRGSLAINKHKEMILERPQESATKGHMHKIFGVIMDSVVMVKDFDESLLLWHIATDLCMRRDFEGPMVEAASRMRAISKTLSEYMLYLLIRQPEMLSARTGIWLMRYHDTCEEARRFFASMAAWNPGHDDARGMLLSVNTSEKPSAVKGDDSLSVLFDAVILAKALRELDEDILWDIVGGVWMEMLIYAARKCPGSTHAKHLNRGGELITVIWLLMEHMGLGDMYQVRTADTNAKIIVHDK